MELTELETHRRLISAQIKREIQVSETETWRGIERRFDRIESRLAEQQNAINIMTSRLMDLALYENRLINEMEVIKRRYSLKKEPK